MTAEFWITIAAIALGPIIAVLLTRELERRHRKRDRQMDVFRDLMRTRRRIFDPAHVSALNLVEIEFFDSKSVMARFKHLMEFFTDGLSRRSDEKDDTYWNRYGDEHSSRLTMLLHEMGQQLGYGYQQLGILKGGYNPLRFGDLEQQQENALRLFSEIYQGKRALPIAVFDYRLPEQIAKAAQETEARLAALAEEKR